MRNVTHLSISQLLPNPMIIRISRHVVKHYLHLEKGRLRKLAYSNEYSKFKKKNENFWNSNILWKKEELLTGNHSIHSIVIFVQLEHQTYISTMICKGIRWKKVKLDCMLINFQLVEILQQKIISLQKHQSRILLFKQIDLTTIMHINKPEIHKILTYSKKISSLVLFTTFHLTNLIKISTKNLKSKQTYRKDQKANKSKTKLGMKFCKLEKQVKKY